jgi:hypothetical protein
VLIMVVAGGVVDNGHHGPATRMGDIQWYKGTQRGRKDIGICFRFIVHGLCFVTIGGHSF